MPNQKISELTTATNPSVSDVLPIVNGGSTKKITAASLMSNTLSASTVSLSGVSLRMGIDISSSSNTSGLSIHNALGQIAIGDSSTGQTFRNFGSARTLACEGNVFIGAGAGKGVSKGVYGAYPKNNIAIGTSAGYRLGGDDDVGCSGRKCINQENVIIGNYAALYLCADGSYTSRNNVIIGHASFRQPRNRAFGNVTVGHSAGRYHFCSGNNVIIGNEASGSFCSGGGGWENSYPVNNVVVGARAGNTIQGTNCCNVMVGYRATIGANRRNSVAIGSRAYACNSYSVSIGACALARNQGDITIGYCSFSKTAGGHQIVIGRGNCFTNTDVGSPLSGAIVLGSCNQNISTSFVLGSPMFPLSARIDTTLSGQVSSLFVTINGVNRRIPILS